MAIAFIAIIIGQVKAVMEEISSDDPDKKAQLKVLDRYLERHAVPQEARTKARAHLIFMHNRLLTAKYTGLLAKLPPRLRTHVAGGGARPGAGEMSHVCSGEEDHGLVSGGAVYEG